jgi:PPOX class probable F420-dependent enzyme
MGTETHGRIPEKARKILRKSFAQAATLSPDGSPRVAPVRVELEGDDIVINTTQLRMKANNLRQEGQVTIAAIDPDNPADAVIVRGRVSEAIYEGAGEQVYALGKRFEDEYPARGLGERRVKLHVEPQQVSTANE